jgi:hypothetical protein
MISGENLATTPKTIDDKVIELCRKIDPTKSPVYIDVLNDSRLKKDNCFENVDVKVRQEGGRVQYGWTIWEHPNVMIEGEFHAVWVNPKGQMIDITPKTDAEAKILFLPDSTRIYKNELVDNVRMLTVETPENRLTVKIGEAKFELSRKYSVDGIPKVPIEEYHRMLARFGLNPGHRDSISPYDPCPCESGKKFKFCCQETIRNIISRARKRI